MSVTSIQHLLAWFTPARRKLIVGTSVDRQAHRPVGSFARFLANDSETTFERIDLTPYYPVLQLLGYLPPGDVWVPRRSLTAAETSNDIREWFTPERRKLINFRTLDSMAKRPPGVFGRYLGNEEHLTFKIIGIDVYHQALQMLGFEPQSQHMDTSIDFITASEHLLTWFTPERRRFINSLTLDQDAGQPEGTLSEFLAGYRVGQRKMAKVGLSRYYSALEVLGYSPDLDLTKDVSVQRHEARLQMRPN